MPARLVSIFTRQLSTMLLAGVPLLRALETLQENEECPDLGQVVIVCGDLVSAGHTFSQACSRFPRVFPTVYVNMVRMGEQVGQLDQSLDRLALWLEKDDALRQRLVSAFTYPCFILAVAATLTLALFYTVLPGFLGIFREMNIPLPLITRVVMVVTDATRSPGAWLLGFSCVGLAVAAVQWVLARRRWKVAAYRQFLRVPLLGRVLLTGSIARFCSAAAALMLTGLELTRCYKLAASTSGSPLLEKDSQALIRSIEEGQLASAHLEANPEIYPPSLSHLVAAGEEVSQLPELLGRASYYFEEECNFLVDSLSAAVEPILLAFVATVIATIVLSIFLPLYSYIGNLGS